MSARVLLVVDSLDGGGAERHVCELARALVRRGWAVSVACSAGGVLRRRLDAAGAAVHVLGGRLVKRRASAAYAGDLRELLDELEPDLVHAHVHASEVAAAAALADDPRPLVLTEHTEAPWRGPAEQAAVRAALARADLVLAVSSAVRRHLVDDLGSDPGRTRLLLPAVVAPAGRAPRPAARRRDGRCIGFVGRLTPEKGVDVLLAALPRVRAELPDARLLVVGDGPQRGALATRAAELGPAVRLLGFQEDVEPVLRRMGVLAVPSLSDGSPLVVPEANAAGVPVVATEVGGLPDRVRPGSDGLLVPAGDPEALAAALLRVLTDPALARRLAEAGRLRAARETHAGMVSRIERAYAALLGRSGSGSAVGRPPIGVVAASRSTASQNLWRTGVV